MGANSITTIAELEKSLEHNLLIVPEKRGVPVGAWLAWRGAEEPRKNVSLRLVKTLLRTGRLERGTEAGTDIKDPFNRNKDVVYVLYRLKA